jgi:hypothetical protein
VIALLAAASLCSTACGDAQSDNNYNYKLPVSGDKVDEALKELANKWAGSLPQQVDSRTELKQVMAGHRQLVFHATCIVPPETFFNINSMKNKMQNRFDTMPQQMRTFTRENEITFNYIYSDQDGRVLGEFKINSAGAQSTNTQGDDEKLDKFLALVASKVPAPETIDSTTRLDAVVAAHRQLTYQYTITVPFDQVGPEAKSEMQKTFDAEPDVAILKENGVTIACTYKDRDGKYLGEFQFVAGKK